MSTSSGFSIVTPTLNQGVFLTAALDSIANQTIGPLEHVVVDGGSSDGTPALLAKRARSIRSISEPDRGMYDAINKGLALTTGDILGYLNADDAYMPWTLERVAAAFEANPGVDMLFGDGLRIRQDNGRQELRLFPPFEQSNIRSVGSLMQPTVFWRRRLMDRIGPFDSNLRFVGDLDYWLRASKVAPIAHIDEVLAVELIHERSLSATQVAAMGIEDQEMRRSHGARPETSEGRLAIARATRMQKFWQRRNWLRFLAASVGIGRTKHWSHFLTEGGVKVDRTRVLLGQLPRGGDRYLPDAVVSELAASLVGARS